MVSSSCFLFFQLRRRSSSIFTHRNIPSHRSTILCDNSCLSVSLLFIHFLSTILRENDIASDRTSSGQILYSIKARLLSSTRTARRPYRISGSSRLRIRIRVVVCATACLMDSKKPIGESSLSDFHFFSGHTHSSNP